MARVRAARSGGDVFPANSQLAQDVRVSRDYLAQHRLEMLEWARGNLEWDAVAVAWSAWLDGAHVNTSCFTRE